MLPTDFDIFSSSIWTIPLCIQIRARGDAAGRLGLGDLVLVVGEDEVDAAAVDREVGAELLLGHRRALDVPARAARAPRASPRRCPPPPCCALPEREVERVLLQRGGAGLLALVHLLGVAVGELAVAVEAADAEVDVAVRPRRRARPRSGASIRETISAIVSVASGSESGRPRPERVGVLDVGGGHLRGELGRGPRRPRGRRRRSCR